MGRGIEYFIAGVTKKHMEKNNYFDEIVLALFGRFGGLEKGRWVVKQQWLTVYLELVYFVTALVPSETACLASSPGRIRRTAV